MRPVTGPYRRPLLGIRRATTRAACAALGLEPWDDPQNADPRYQRVRLRHEVLPLLEDVLQGGVAEALARTATQLQRDLDALERAASVHLIETPDAEWPSDSRTSTRRSGPGCCGTGCISNGVPPGELQRDPSRRDRCG